MHIVYDKITIVIVEYKSNINNNLINNKLSLYYAIELGSN